MGETVGMAGGLEILGGLRTYRGEPSKEEIRALRELIGSGAIACVKCQSLARQNPSHPVAAAAGYSLSEMQGGHYSITLGDLARGDLSNAEPVDVEPGSTWVPIPLCQPCGVHINGCKDCRTVMHVLAGRAAQESKMARRAASN